MKKILFCLYALSLSACSIADTDNNGVVDRSRFEVKYQGKRYSNINFAIFDNKEEKSTFKMNLNIIGDSLGDSFFINTNNLSPYRLYGFYAYNDRNNNGKYDNGEYITQGKILTKANGGKNVWYSCGYDKLKGNELGLGDIHISFDNRESILDMIF